MRKGLILAAMLIAALPARATIALVQHTTKDAASAASTTLAYGSNPAANHLLITVVRGADTLTGITTTDTIGNTWTKGTFHAVASICSLQISWAINSTTAADTVTITPNANSAMRVAIYEYSGAATSSPLDAENNTQTGTGTALASTSITPAAGNELVFGVGATGNNHAETWTAGANFTVEDTVGANLILATEDWIQTTATATTAPLTASVSDTWLAAIAVFKAAGGAAAPAGTNKREKLEKIDSQRRRR
jgi:hypothetical protein